MDDCIFCKIAQGDIPSKMIYQDTEIFAFYDIEPAAKTHFLVIPKQHVLSSAAEITDGNADIIAHIFVVIAKITKQLGIEGGFRVVTNSGADAGQTVKHLHFHVIGGEELGKMA